METTKWVLDPNHSEIQFKIRHLMISNVTGSFTSFAATAETEGDNFKNANVKFTAQINSITTNMPQRDSDLKGPLFFDAEKFPEITFTSTSLGEADADGKAVLMGDLSIKGVTKKVTLEVDPGGVAEDRFGNTKTGFSISGKINRHGFGLTWNAPVKTGGVVLGDEVRIFCEVQMLKQVAVVA